MRDEYFSIGERDESSFLHVAQKDDFIGQRVLRMIKMLFEGGVFCIRTAANEPESCLVEKLRSAFILAN
ncbi:hypothetical protein AWV80_03955 [Cupriavidus sp. UYMU48A]|nr:hypothetical protein AWV80_03955 [Cupriavidus sp. UYMU48A]